MIKHMKENDKIYVAGHLGLAGSAICRKLHELGFGKIITRTSTELDLRNQAAVEHFFAQEKPNYVFLAAAKVGGIYANNTYPADFIRDNLQIQTNVIDSSYKNGVKKLLFLGSACIYPKHCPQPIKEEYLLTAPLEPTNECYAIAKIAGIKMCQAYRSQYGFDAICAMPTNLYGQGDNFHPENSHVLPALIRRFDEAKKSGAKEVVIWGTGTSRREFLYADDLADALIFLMQNYSDKEIINVGSGKDISILELAQIVAKSVGFTGIIKTDSSKPDGTPIRLLKTNTALKGWQPQIDLLRGLELAYKDFLKKA